MSDPSPLDSSDVSPGAGTVPGARLQTAVGAGVLLVAAVLAWGALQVPGDAGYGGVGPNFLPWVCAAVLTLCGAWLVWEARSGGFRAMAVPTGSAKADWNAAVWVSAGLLLNAALITSLGFILSCTLCLCWRCRGCAAPRASRRRAGRAPGAWT